MPTMSLATATARAIGAIRTDSLAREIEACRARLAHAEALLADLEIRLESLYPTPLADCDEATFDRWNNLYEDARCEAGGFSMDDAIRSEQTLLIALCREALAPIARRQGAEAAEAHEVAFAAALGDGRRLSFDARRRVIGLCSRLDVATL